tara:strand:+ start:456 stop:971 length:516 start_codon:yes stop_codon:yes gene_type:complete
MKLTKQKLEQLILQEMRYFRPPEFNPRLDKEYPQHSSTLSDMYKSDIDQARSLSQGLRFDDELPDDEQVMEPIDVEIPETDEEPEEFIPFGIHQFKQVSPVTAASMPLGIVEIFFNTDDYVWVVSYYRGPNSGGGYSYDYANSQEYARTESEKAIQHYNALADNKFVYKST